MKPRAEAPPRPRPGLRRRLGLPPADTRLRPQVLLAVGSVASIALVVFTAAALGPESTRFWLLVCGTVAVAAAVQSVTIDQADLTIALLFSVPPVVSLVSDGSPTLLIGPLGALLLLAGELNALSWECHAVESLSPVRRRRLINSARLAALGCAAALTVGGLARGAAHGGTLLVLTAAAAIAALGGVVFRPRA